MEVELGKIVGVWGVKGWIKLHSFTRNRVDIAQYKTWWLQPANLKRSAGEAAKGVEEQFISVKVLSCREQGKGVVAQIEGVNDPDQAIALNGHSIWVKQADLPALPTGQFYWQQLIGLRVSNTMSQDLGVIESVLETGANDVLVIKAAEGSLLAEGSNIQAAEGSNLQAAEGSNLQAAEGSNLQAAEGSKVAQVAEILVPYADEIIQEIDIEQGTMIVDWDPSYLDE
ncbi:MAG: 16S rRNA processing protein RimM [Polaribacter sp.]|jgi:16S rRNA processing protein RimM